MQADLNDFIIVQAIEGLDSRSSINLEYNPIFVAPMDTVISKNNMGEFIRNDINVCLPRGQHSEPNDQVFTSFGIEGFEALMEDEIYNYNGAKILIDVCQKYGLSIKFVLAQGQLESHFGTKGLARKTNSIFNVPNRKI